jgi:hypothetical protein
MSHRFLSYLFFATGVLGLIGWVYCAHMMALAPKAPDAAHTVAMNNHGTVYYFTPLEAAFGPLCWLVVIMSSIASWRLYAMRIKNASHHPQKVNSP